MKKILGTSTLRFLFILCLLSTSVFAQRSIHLEGTVLQVNNAFINIDDNQFPLLSTVKVVYLPGKKTGRLSDLKKGDNVRIEIIIIAKKLYVDTIYILQELTQYKINEGVRNK